MIKGEVKKGVEQSQGAKPKLYNAWAYSMYGVSLVHLLAIAVQSLCFKSPVPDLLIICFLLYIVQQVADRDSKRNYVFGAAIYLGVTVVFDIVASSHQIWSSVNGPMERRNYFDGGEFQACRNATLSVVWVQVICKLLDVAGLLLLNRLMPQSQFSE